MPNLRKMLDGKYVEQIQSERCLPSLGKVNKMPPPGVVLLKGPDPVKLLCRGNGAVSEAQPPISQIQCRPRCEVKKAHNLHFHASTSVHLL